VQRAEIWVFVEKLRGDDKIAEVFEEAVVLSAADARVDGTLCYVRELVRIGQQRERVGIPTKHGEAWIWCPEQGSGGLGAG
jgi:hypothetical protein